MSSDGNEQLGDGIDGIDPNAPEVTEGAGAGAGGGQVTTTSTSDPAKPTPTVELIFENDKIFGNNAKEHNRVFEVTNDSDPFRFTWGLNDDNLNLVNASLWGGDKVEEDSFEEIWPEIDRSRFVGAVEKNGVTLAFDMFASNLILRNAATTDSEAAAKYLALKVHWKTEEFVEGFNYSPYFSVVDSDRSDADSLAEFVQNELSGAGDKALEGWSMVGSTEIIGDGTGDQGSGSEPGQDENKTEPGGGSEQPNENENEGGANSSDGNEDGGSSGGGGGSRLSTGAIAGIAVGGAVVLVAIGVLIWFVLRRQRTKTKGRAEYSQSPDLANDYISGKDGNDAEINSPYSEDGGHATQQTPFEPNAAVPPTSSTPASFAPYQDQENSHNNNHLARTATSNSMSAHSNSPIESIPRSDTQMSNRASQQHKQGVSSRVAHLVEEGMTPDEIQRLEDEERQLDLEIERAGRR